MHTIDKGIKENFFQWKGRLNRKRYIMRLLVLTLAVIAVYIAFSAAFLAYIVQADLSEAEIMRKGPALEGLLLLCILPFTVSGYMLMIRRLHDIDLTGYFVLLNFIPFVNLGLLLYVLFKKGTEGDNAYGPDPLEGSAVQASYAEGAAVPEAASQDPYAHGGDEAHTDDPPR